MQVLLTKCNQIYLIKLAIKILKFYPHTDPIKVYPHSDAFNGNSNMLQDDYIYIYAGLHVQYFIPPILYVTRVTGSTMDVVASAFPDGVPARLA